MKDSADVFLELVGELATFTGVEIVCFPALRPPSLFSALSSSPSCRRLSYLTLLDEAFSRDAPHPRTEVELVSFLATLPALSTFHFNPICLVPPSSPSLDFTHTLSITSFSSDRGHHDVPAPIFLPGVPRQILSSAINPTTLREFTFRLDYEAPDGWMHWISSPGFTALRTLTLTILPPFCTSDMFPLLSSILLHHPLLSELNLQDREDFGRIYEKDDPALSTFFTTLPPALELIRFRFRCPHENALQSYLAYERSSKLRFFECRTRNSGEIFRLEWNAPLQKCDTVRFFLLPFLLPFTFPFPHLALSPCSLILSSCSLHPCSSKWDSASLLLLTHPY